MAQCREAYSNCLRSTWHGCVTCSEAYTVYEIYASLNGALGLDYVELLSAKQIRLTAELFASDMLVDMGNFCSIIC